MTTDDSDLMLGAMCCELENWCLSQDLPFESADELLCRDDLKLGQRSWLQDFYERWNVVWDRKASSGAA